MFNIIQVFYNVPRKAFSRRKLDPRAMIGFIDRTTKLEPRSAEHIARAIRWYRLGAMTEDVFDSFDCFWIGLEALNPLLQSKMVIGDDKAMCPNCRYEWVPVPTVSGIRSFIQNELQDGRELYRNIRDLRNSIAHSTKPLKEILALSAQYTPKTGEALFRAICYILGYPEWQTVAHEAILREFPIRGEIQGILIGGDSASLGQDGQDPYLEIHHRLTGSRINEATEAVDYDGETTFTARFASNVSLKSPEIRFYGDSQTAGTMRGKTLRAANGKETQI